jgi:uncharacterized protein YciI
MQFVVTGRDGDDAQARERRTRAREAHLALGDRMRDSGNLLFAVALLDDRGDMVGSLMIVDLEDRRGVDEWLEREPYMTGDVWRSVEIRACRVGPSFASPVRPRAGVEPGGS